MQPLTDLRRRAQAHWAAMAPMQRNIVVAALIIVVIALVLGSL